MNETEAEVSELARAIAPIILNELLATVLAIDSPHGQALTRAVYLACDDLQGQGPRSERICLQLLEALSRYELALGQLLIAEEATEETATVYRVMWCAWENGGGSDMQEWHPSDWETTDECEAKDRVKHLDIRFAPKFRHKYEVKP